MSISSLLKRLQNALPVLLAAAPGVIEAARQVQQSFKKPKKDPAPKDASAAPRN